MANTQARLSDRKQCQEAAASTGILLDGFQPLATLWEGASAPYPSRASADWALKRMRRELMARQALARHRGRVFVHLQRFKEVAEVDAARSYSARYQD